MKWFLVLAIPNIAAGVGMSALGFGITTWQHWAVGLPVAIACALIYALTR